MQHPERYAIGDTRYLLVELSEYSAFNVAQTLYELQTAGLVPILTHPERNPLILGKPGLLQGIRRRRLPVSDHGQLAHRLLGKARAEDVRGDAAQQNGSLHRQRCPRHQEPASYPLGGARCGGEDRRRRGGGSAGGRQSRRSGDQSGSPSRSRCYELEWTSAPVAQLDRARVFGTRGCRFEPCQAHHLSISTSDADSFANDSKAAIRVPSIIPPVQIKITPLGNAF